jgi:hypothetical protein
VIYVLQGFDYEDAHEVYYEYNKEVNFESLISEIKLTIINEIHRNLGKTDETFDSHYIYIKIRDELEKRGFKLLRPTGNVSVPYAAYDDCQWYVVDNTKIIVHNNEILAKMNEEENK